jgi:sugar transferase (PEP-CTERM system associated)
VRDLPVDRTGSRGAAMSLFRISKPRFLVYFALEGGLVFSVLYGLAYLTPLLLPNLQQSRALSIAIPTGALFTMTLLATQWSNPTDRGSLVRELVIFTILSLALGTVCFATIWLLFEGRRPLFALVALEGAIAVPLAVALWRWLSVRLHILNVTRDRVLILGTGEVARQVCRWIVSSHGGEYGVVGFIDEDDSREGLVLAMGTRVQTHYDALVDFAPERCDRIIVALDEKRGQLPVRQLMELRLLGVEIEDATSFFERISGKIPVETMLPSWLIFSEGFKTSALRSAMKRTMDLTHSIGLLILSSPVMLLTALLIRLTSRGPVLYRQTRLGKGGREFDVLKFRSMVADAEARSGPTFAQEFDPRVTFIGRLIRPVRIDELPQLINVLRGEMSFVGPRPEREHFVRRLEDQIPYYGLRMTVRPGITGWAQVEYRYGATDEDALEKLKYDLYYIKNGNILFDLWIILKTVKVVLFGTGAR